MHDKSPLKEGVLRDGSDLLELIRCREEELKGIRHLASDVIVEKENKLRQRLEDLQSSLKSNLAELKGKDETIESLRRQIVEITQNHKAKFVDFQRELYKNAEDYVKKQLNQTQLTMEKEFNDKISKKRIFLQQKCNTDLDYKVVEAEKRIRIEIQSLHVSKLKMVTNQLNSEFRRILHHKENIYRNTEQDLQSKLRDLENKAQDLIHEGQLNMKKQKIDLVEAFERDRVPQIKKDISQMFQNEIHQMRSRHNMEMNDKESHIISLTHNLSQAQKNMSKTSKNNELLNSLKVKDDAKISDLMNLLHNVEKAYIIKKRDFEVARLKFIQEMQKTKEEMKKKEVHMKGKDDEYKYELVIKNEEFDCKIESLQKNIKILQKNEATIKKQLEERQMTIFKIHEELELEKSSRKTAERDFRKVTEEIARLRHGNLEAQSNYLEEELRKKFQRSHSKLIHNHNNELESLKTEKNSIMQKSNKLRAKIGKLERKCKDLQQIIKLNNLDPHERMESKTNLSKDKNVFFDESKTFLGSFTSHALDSFLSQLDYGGDEGKPNNTNEFNNILDGCQNVQSTKKEYLSKQENIDANLKIENSQLRSIIALMRKDMENAISSKQDDNYIFRGDDTQSMNHNCSCSNKSDTKRKGYTNENLKDNIQRKGDRCSVKNHDKQAQNQEQKLNGISQESKKLQILLDEKNTQLEEMALERDCLIGLSNKLKANLQRSYSGVLHAEDDMRKEVGKIYQKDKYRTKGKDNLKVEKNLSKSEIKFNKNIHIAKKNQDDEPSTSLKNSIITTRINREKRIGGHTLITASEKTTKSQKESLEKLMTHKQNEVKNSVNIPVCVRNWNVKDDD